MKRNPTPGAKSDYFPGCYLGLDFGTSGARLIAIDAQLDVLFETQRRSSANTATAWRDALFELISSVPPDLRQTTQAIAVCGTSGTSLLCDAAGEPLLPAVLYNEARDVSTLRHIPATHLAANPGSSLAKLLWFSEQPPIGRARYFLHQADWLAMQLHGQPGVSDYHNALKLGYDVAQLRYPDWLMALPVAPLLPRVLVPGTAVGNVRQDIAARLGLPTACWVRAGTTDSIAAFFASGACRPGQAVTSLGSTLVLKLLSRTRVESYEYGVYSHRCGDLWLAGGASSCGGAVLENLFGRERLAALSREIDPAVASNLDYYPLHGIGERFPVNAPDMQPRIEPRPSSDAEYLHGLLESLARIEHQGYLLLERLGATPVDELFSAGGGAHNETWRRIRKRVMGYPMRVAAHTEAAMGAALLAAKGELLLYSEAADSGHCIQ
ncbi:MAG TPA: FGGY-family carbohydrate kinase [Novimethylophilus sp.]|uniref:FGGY-family carbohydrate kinase n=1 Tax=Novimethylophilus sp. TaxID=2137426 RepID=UPI002F40C515